MGAIPEMMVSVGETPWHRKGLVLPDDTVLTPQSAYELGGLDYTIEKRPIMSGDSYELIPGRFQLARRNDVFQYTPIGKQPQIVSDRYEIIQNDEIVRIVEPLDLPVVTAGTMFNSSMAWMLLDLGESVMFKGTEEATQRFLLVAAHHGTGNFVVYVVTVRVVCQNTYDLATKLGDMRWSIKHTASAQDRLSDARYALESAYRKADEMDHEIMRLLDTEFTNDQFRDVVDGIQLPVEATYKVHPVTNEWVQSNTRAQNAAAETRTQLWNIWGNGNDTIPRQSAFHAIQTVNEYEQHYHGQTKNRDQRMMTKFINRDFPMTVKATNLVSELVNIGSD